MRTTEQKLETVNHDLEASKRALNLWIPKGDSKLRSAIIESVIEDIRYLERKRERYLLTRESI